MSTSGTTVPLRGTTVDAHGTTVNPGVVLPQPHKQSVNYGRKTEEAPRKKEGIKGDVYVMIPPKPFQRGPPLNSTAFLRLKSTEKKRRETPSSTVFEGHQIVSCLVMIYLKYSMHVVSPQKHCHQSPKQLRDKYALTISPFLVD